MKGPSLEAIRKFKQQQELKRREEDAKKAEDKLSTLQHRAAQGDRKAKGLLKKIEEDSKQSNSKSSDDVKINHHHGRSSSGLLNDRYSSSSRDVNNRQANNLPKRKPINAVADFDELMRLAQNNNNEIVRREEPKEIPRIRRVKQMSNPAMALPPEPTKNLSTSSKKPQPGTLDRPMVALKPNASSSRALPPSRQQPPNRTHHAPQPGQQRPRSNPGYDRLRSTPGHDRPRPPPDYGRLHPATGYGRSRLPMRRPIEDDDYYDYEDEDEYESDGFVVDEDEDRARIELKKTLKDIFHYDKRRADLKEQEVERHYREIGNVSTFEDLEREERRASRLATAEDAREARLEEERKRQKKIRLKGLR